VEPLTRALDGRRLHGLARASRVRIKPFLMDGKRIVGVGNIYASESLFLAGIDPRKAAGRLSAEHCGRLAAAIKRTLRTAIRAGGSSLRDFVGSDGARAVPAPPGLRPLGQKAGVARRRSGASCKGSGQPTTAPTGETSPAISPSPRGLARTAGCTNLETSPPSVAISLHQLPGNEHGCCRA
jgi:hypothetical protein